MSALAAVDCGTNSTRLLIVDEHKNRLVEELRITRLGERVHANRYLLDSAINRTLSALEEFASLINQHDVRSVRAVATSAVRDSDNRDEFLVRAREVLGVDVELLAGSAEAQLSYSGAVGGLAGEVGLLAVIDIGGGSTEVVVGRGSEIEFSHSFDVGSVRLTEMFLASDPPGPGEMRAAADWVDQLLRKSIRPKELSLEGVKAVAVGGTATTLAALDGNMRSYDFNLLHGYGLDVGDLARLVAWLETATVAERIRHPFLPSGRAEVIAGGAVVLRSLAGLFRVNEIMVSCSDILDGMIESIATPNR